GEVDEGLPALTCGEGACLRTAEACIAGVPQICTPGAPTDESCNGIDDDCNGIMDDGGDVLCDDGDPCTSDRCHQGEGCAHEISGACHASPRGVGFWRRLCDGPHPDGEITQADLECVKETCTFAGLQSLADMCARLDPAPPGDKCAQADAQLMALTLNHCQGRIVDTAPILSTCSASTTIGQSRAEADALLCGPLRDPQACQQALCQAEEINAGTALQANSLRLRRQLDGGIRLAWAPPYGDTESGPPDVYRVRRRSGSEAPFEDLIETPDLFYVDPGATALPAAQYEVTPIWK
ncbi:MAG TPA: hypothetical protein VFO11_09540, partial [Candidatus Polarisedimenticolaceae bacterium]|nr:hypothetical protein [Candidatus Polarisedimenticolaceae bacterium]